ncbi:GSCOCG00000081001-RA-CDS, partial [Cotesia congregata]
MDANGNGKRAANKSIDAFYRQQKQDSDVSSECADLDFIYDDADTHVNEIAELYSYTEQYELQLNLKVSFLFFFFYYYTEKKILEWS